MSEIKNLLSQPEISIQWFLVNLVIGAILAQLISWHYNHFAKSLSNRSLFSRVFPLITLTTILVISVVKSSLALSLGLVGALSIVRFRTPIKDPEELGYIFLAIATGLGLGADRRVETVVAVAFILFAMTLYVRMSEKRISNWMYVVIIIDGDFKTDGNGIAQLNAIMRDHTISADMRRLEINGTAIEVNYFVRFDDPANVDTLTSVLNAKWPSVNVAFSEQRQIAFG